MVVKYKGKDAQILNKLHSQDELVVYNQLVKIPTDELERMSIIQIRQYVMKNIERAGE
jgi:hypothetical protein